MEPERTAPSATKPTAGGKSVEGVGLALTSVAHVLSEAADNIASLTAGVPPETLREIRKAVERVVRELDAFGGQERGRMRAHEYAKPVLGEVLAATRRGCTMRLALNDEQKRALRDPRRPARTERRPASARVAGRLRRLVRHLPPHRIRVPGGRAQARRRGGDQTNPPAHPSARPRGRPHAGRLLPAGIQDAGHQRLQGRPVPGSGSSRPPAGEASIGRGGTLPGRAVRGAGGSTPCLATPTASRLPRSGRRGCAG